MTKSIAFHEAGHAIMCLEKGLKFHLSSLDKSTIKSSDLLNG